MHLKPYNLVLEMKNTLALQGELMSNFRQQPNEQIHALNTRITTLINNCKFQDHQTTETIKIVLLQHAVKFHKARDWILAMGSESANL